MNAKPTLKELSAITGISMSTISRALNMPQKVKYSTRLRIESAIQEFQRQGLHSRRGIIGMIVPDIANQFFPLMLEGINSAADDFDNTIMLCNSDGSREKEEIALKKLMDIDVDGIIYTATEQPPALLTEVIKHNILPIVFLDRDPGLPNINVVTTDNKNGMYQATRYLITLGHRNLLYLGGRKGTSTDEERMEGFHEAITDTGIDEACTGIIHGNFTMGQAYKEISNLLDKDEFRYTAIAAANDVMAIGAIKALNDHGIIVPKDVSVIGYDDIPTAAFTDLTTVKQPFREMGRTAILQLIAAIADSNTPRKKTMLPSSITFRGSCSVVKG